MKSAFLSVSVVIGLCTVAAEGVRGEESRWWNPFSSRGTVVQPVASRTTSTPMIDGRPLRPAKTKAAEPSLASQMAGNTRSFFSKTADAFRPNKKKATTSSFSLGSQGKKNRAKKPSNGSAFSWLPWASRDSESKRPLTTSEWVGGERVKP